MPATRLLPTRRTSARLSSRLSSSLLLYSCSGCLPYCTSTLRHGHTSRQRGVSTFRSLIHLQPGLYCQHCRFPPFWVSGLSYSHPPNTVSFSPYMLSKAFPTPTTYPSCPWDRRLENTVISIHRSTIASYLYCSIPRHRSVPGGPPLRSMPDSYPASQLHSR